MVLLLLVMVLLLLETRFAHYLVGNPLCTEVGQLVRSARVSPSSLEEMARLLAPLLVSSSTSSSFRRLHQWW